MSVGNVKDIGEILASIELLKEQADHLNEMHEHQDNAPEQHRLPASTVAEMAARKADVVLLDDVYCKGKFTRNDFINGVYTYSWDKNRWERLRRDGWIDIWRQRNRTTIKYSIYKTSFKCSQLISRIYRIMLAEEDLPTSERSVFYNNKSYTDKVYNKAIDDMIKDKNR